VLATGRGIEVAAWPGLPVVLGGPVLTRPELGDLLVACRRDFCSHRDNRPARHRLDRRAGRRNRCEGSRAGPAGGVGDGAREAHRLEQLAERTGADDLLASGATYERAARTGSDAALAALLT